MGTARSRGLAAGAVLSFVAAALALPAGGAQGPYPPLEVNATQFEQGATITVRGRGCEGLANVTVDNYSVVLTPPGRAQGLGFTDHSPRAADGSWTASRGLGQGLPAGAYDVLAVCMDTMQGVPYGRVQIVVLPPVSPSVNASLTVTPATVRPGDTVVASGSGFYGSLGTVGFFLYPMRQHLGTVFSDQPGGGRASVSFAVPAGLAPGTYQVIAQNNTGGLRTAAGSFTVASPAVVPTAPPATAPPTTAASTSAPASTSTSTASTSSTSAPASTTTSTGGDGDEDEQAVEPVASTGGEGGASSGAPAGLVVLAGAVVVAGFVGGSLVRRGRQRPDGPSPPA
jgi:hypothetical protein